MTEKCSLYAGSVTSRGHVNGSLKSARFRTPNGLRVLRGAFPQPLIVCDWGGEYIKLVHDGQVSTFAGIGVGALIDGPREKAAFDGPYDIVESSTVDRLFIVSDWYNHVIRIITPDGMVSTVGSTRKTSNSLFSGWRFAYPRGLTAAPDGSVYICDSGTHAILRLRFGLGEKSERMKMKMMMKKKKKEEEEDEEEGDGDDVDMEHKKNHQEKYEKEENGEFIIHSIEINHVAGTRGESGYGDTKDVARRERRIDVGGGRSKRSAERVMFKYPTGIAYADGSLLVADHSNHRIRRISLVDGLYTVSTINREFLLDTVEDGQLVERPMTEQKSSIVATHRSAPLTLHDDDDDDDDDGNQADDLVAGNDTTDGHDGGYNEDEFESKASKLASCSTRLAYTDSPNFICVTPRGDLAWTEEIITNIVTIQSFTNPDDEPFLPTIHDLFRNNNNNNNNNTSASSSGSTPYLESMPIFKTTNRIQFKSRASAPLTLELHPILLHHVCGDHFMSLLNTKGGHNAIGSLAPLEEASMEAIEAAILLLYATPFSVALSRIMRHSDPETRILFWMETIRIIQSVVKEDDSGDGSEGACDLIFAIMWRDLLAHEGDVQASFEYLQRSTMAWWSRSLSLSSDQDSRPEMETSKTITETWRGLDSEEIRRRILLLLRPSQLSKCLPTWKKVLSRMGSAASELIPREEALKRINSGDSSTSSLPSASSFSSSSSSSSYYSDEPNFVITVSGCDQAMVVHEWVMYARWPYFRRICESGLSEVIAKHVELPAELDIQSLSLLVKYMYTQEAPPKDNNDDVQNDPSTSSPSSIRMTQFLDTFGEEFGFRSSNGEVASGFKALFSNSHHPL